MTPKQRKPYRNPKEILADQLADQIHTGDLIPGQRLPSGRDLAEQHGVAYNTARDALRLLQDRGLAVIRIGSGAYVTEHPTISDPTERLTRIYSGRPLLRAGERSEITRTSMDPQPSDAVAAHLGLAEGEEAAYREYVVFSPARPVIAGTSWFRPDIAAAVPALLMTEPLLGGNLGAIRAATGQIVGHMSVQVEARKPRERERHNLQLSEDAMVLCVVTDCVESDGTTLEYNESAHPADHIVAIGKLA